MARSAREQLRTSSIHLLFFALHAGVAAAVILAFLYYFRRFPPEKVDSIVAFYGVAVALIGVPIAIPLHMHKTMVAKTVQEELPALLEAHERSRDVTAREGCQDQIHQLDAHLSRMVAYLLLANGHHAWSLGWTFRSAHRYSLLKNDGRGRRRQHDLMRQLVQQARYIMEEVKLRSLWPLDPSQCAALRDRIGELLGLRGPADHLKLCDHETREEARSRLRRVAIRMLKEYFDVEAELKERLRLQGGDPGVREREASSLVEVIRLVAVVAPYSVSLVHTLLVEGGDSRTIEERVDELRRSIGEISYFRLHQTSDYSENDLWSAFTAAARDETFVSYARKYFDAMPTGPDERPETLYFVLDFGRAAGHPV